MLSLLSLLLLASSLSPDAAAQQPGDAPPVEELPPEELPPLLVEPQLTGFVEAPYPPEAQAAGIEGSVLLLIEISETGAVSHVEVLQSAGNGFDEAAVEAAKAFVFTPAEDETGPVPVAVEFAYGFTLDKSQVVPEEELPPEALPVTLEGEAIEMGTRRPIDEMAVTINGTDFTATTDAEGKFQIRGVPPGSYAVQVARPGWENRSVVVEVVEGEVTNVKLWVKNLSYGDDEAVGVYRRVTEEVTRRTISVEEVRRIPGTFGDPVRVIQSLPGAARSPFGTGGLIIRGSNLEDSGVYIQGIRIPLIYHLGGYVSVINSDLVEAVDYLPGGYGVQYGRSMGGVVDVSIRKEAPERPKINWSTDLLDSGGLFEGRLGEDGQHHVGVAARRSYIDWVIQPFLQNAQFVAAPKWYDYQLRYFTESDRGTEVTGFLFGFRDSLLVSTPDSTAQGTDADTQGDVASVFGTHRVLVEINHPISDTLSARLVPSFGYDYAYFGLGSAIELEQDQWLLELRAEAPWEPSEHFLLTPGVDFIGGYYTFGFNLPFDIESDFDAIGEREDYSQQGDGTAWGPDFYLKARIRPLEDPDALMIVPGIRTSYVNIVDQYSTLGVDPRISARARVIDGGFLKAGLGVYTQPPQPFESWHPDGNIVLGMERARSAALGWDQDFGLGIHGEIEGFYKQLDDLIVGNPDYSVGSDPYWINGGIGRIYGMEVMARKDPVGRVFGWVSYTLSRSERIDYPESGEGEFDPFASGAGDQWYLFEFDQTHILVALAGYRLPYDFGVSGRFQYTTGNPTTPYAGGVYDVDQDFYFPYQTAEYNSERLPAYAALDLRADKRFTFKRGTLELYVDFLNAYKGENPEFVLYNYDYTESRYVSGLPFIPSPGFQLEFTL